MKIQNIEELRKEGVPECVLHYFLYIKADLSMESVAQLLGCSIGKVSWLIYKYGQDVATNEQMTAKLVRKYLRKEAENEE